MAIGASASAASSTWLRRRRNTNATSPLANRPNAPGRGEYSSSVAAVPREDRASSASDIEAISGEFDEQVFQGGAWEPQLAEGHLSGCQRGANRLGLHHAKD